MNAIHLHDFRQALIQVSEKMIAHQKYLCELDSYIGDGDHGVTIARGFAAVKETLEQNKYSQIGEMLDNVGKTLVKNMGGAIGPLFGSIFTSAGQAVHDKQRIEVQDLYIMFEASLKTIKQIGGVQEGDRTIVDALSPTVDAFKEALDRNLSLVKALELAEKKAAKGVEETKKMVAKKGRARFLGEKSIGYQDAGATSFYLIVSILSEYFADTGGRPA